MGLHLVLKRICLSFMVIGPFGSSLASPTIQGCQVFPSDNIWNTAIDTLPSDDDPTKPNHVSQINAIGSGTALHMDFGANNFKGKPIGIPYNTVQTPINTCSLFSFTVRDESDNSPNPQGECNVSSSGFWYPVPSNPKIESNGRGDQHLLILSKSNNNCYLYETFQTSLDSRRRTGSAYAGSVFDMNSNHLRPLHWTSADAAGLPILPGLVRYEEASTGKIEHALRFTVSQTNAKYIWPARHKTDYPGKPICPTCPPMGARFRLQAVLQMPGAALDDKIAAYITSKRLTNDNVTKALLYAMSKYGLIVADNGSPWYISGVPNSNWNDTNLNKLANSLKGSDFVPVDTTCMMAEKIFNIQDFYSNVNNYQDNLINSGTLTPNEKALLLSYPYPATSSIPRIDNSYNAGYNVSMSGRADRTKCSP